MVKQSAKLGLLALCAALSACSVLDGEKIDYKSAGKGASLDVPPDLTQLSRESRYVVPGGPVTASGYQTARPVVAAPTAANTLGDVRVERAGNTRWLVVNRPADQLWGPVREFWQESGFNLVISQADLGIMETDWAENRAKIPQDVIRSAIGKIFESLYSTSERDRFRTRLERNASGATEIYISHRGMIEVYTTNFKDQTSWQPRPVDPELEAEFLRRLMVKLGTPKEEAQAKVDNAAPAKQVARTSTVNNQPVVLIDEGFDRAWRRVGLALDRTGFTVEDRDRTQGTYFVRYVEPGAEKREPGFFAKLFGASDSSVAPLKYRISVKSQGDATTVSVLNAAGAPDSSANAQRIVQVIADDLK